MISLKKDIRFHSNEVRIVHYNRFEGASNPEYTSIIECNNGEKGNLVDGFDTTTETANFMLNVKNQE
jgi:hypothetical protein